MTQCASAYFSHAEPRSLTHPDALPDIVVVRGHLLQIYKVRYHMQQHHFRRVAYIHPILEYLCMFTGEMPRKWTGIGWQFWQSIVCLEQWKAWQCSSAVRQGGSVMQLCWRSGTPATCNIFIPCKALIRDLNVAASGSTLPMQGCQGLRAGLGCRDPVNCHHIPSLL